LEMACLPWWQTAISSNCEYPAGMPQVMYKQSSLKSSQRSLTKRARGMPVMPVF
jgi:hypothetical protein